MKPPAFDYSRPTSTREAVNVLAELGEDGNVLAGGQSLLPLLNMRLAAPRNLVDINAVTELDYLRVTPDGVRVGALSRHSALERSDDAARVQPLLRQAVRLVAHATIRNRGTTVGSIVHADPSGEMTAVLSLLGGSVRVAGSAGERTVPAEDFFLGPLESAVRPGELAVEAFFPARTPGSGSSFTEISRRHGDYAVCGVGAVVELDADLRVCGARAAFLSISPTPLVLDLAEVVHGRSFDDTAIEELSAYVQARIDPQPDIHATAAYRSHLAGALTLRAVREAARAAADLERTV
ncbi:xanthine dehydrogenase family protein subunit M [Pseudonocardia bannensis]|uniref:Xanthine dehydrogenase family protein subunit M n=1 Tax=Pseudonocardia bannensis TaxID=630973 RepID=A0A848DK00_9PSEU|nr:FAD binding domain-containing protein [Pseudonocardia bannensis]NMH93028.1 xanthine dehydrogenase family protein subunit M [Pseudonocardia bannensis]